MMLSAMKKEWSMQEKGKKNETAKKLEDGVSQFNVFYAELMRISHKKPNLRNNDPDLKTL